MSKSPSEGDFASPLILVVDDHPENLTILEADLEEAGYQVALAESGPIALERLAVLSPDLVLLDVSMPVMDGLEVCRRIRRQSQSEDLPVIMVTGRDAAKDIVAGLDAGANDYVTKPIQPETLLARIRTQLRLKQLQDNLKDTIAQLEELQRLRSDFVAMITHDMKAPLTSVVGFASMLLEGAVGVCPSKPFEDALKNIHQNGHKLTQLINDFLTLSRIEAGKLAIEYEPVNLTLSTLQVMSLYRYQADRKQIRMEFAPPERLSSVSGDAEQIERAIGNVLNNALKFGTEGKPIHLRLKEQEDWIHLEIEDQGPGISADLIPHLFKRYSRLQTAGKIEGTGLGLAIVKSIVEAHRGNVGIESQPDQGTTVRLCFPVMKEEEPQNPPFTRGESVNGG